MSPTTPNRKGRDTKKKLMENLITPPGKGYRHTRGASTLKKAITRNPKYKNFRNLKDKVVEDFLVTEKCHLCNKVFLTPKKRHCMRDAIDHDHALEETDIPGYRGRLCQHCNVCEGITLKQSKRTGDDHYMLLARLCNTTIKVVDAYFVRSVF